MSLLSVFCRKKLTKSGSAGGQNTIQERCMKTNLLLSRIHSFFKNADGERVNTLYQECPIRLLA